MKKIKTIRRNPLDDVLKYIVLGILVASALVFALLVFTRKAEASWSYPHYEYGNWSSWSSWSKCRAAPLVCGKAEGTQTRERTRNCNKTWCWGISECSSSQTQTQNQACIVDFGDCTPEETCPTECGYPGGNVPDGKGGDKFCEATVACEVDVCENLDGMQTEVPEGYYEEEGSCYEKEEPKPEPKPERPKFAEDTRCFDIAVPDVTWFDVATGEPEDNKLDLSWSAEMGDKVEIKFSEDPEDLRWTIITENDGHEQVGNLENGTHYWFTMRTINSDCAMSNWTPIVDPLP